MLIKNILVAVDFNEAVGEMLTYAEHFAEKFEAKVWLVHVAEADPDFVGYEIDKSYKENAKTIIQGLDIYSLGIVLPMTLYDLAISKNIAAITVEDVLKIAKHHLNFSY